MSPLPCGAGQLPRSALLLATRPVFLWLLAMAWAASASADGQRQTLYGRDVVALFHEPDRAAALTAVEAADDLSARLQTELGYQLGRRAAIIVCSTHAELEREAGRWQGVWVLGLAIPEADRVLVKALPQATLRRVTRHELAHLFLSKALGEDDAIAPRWLHEGAAKYYSDDWSDGERVLLSEALREGKLYRVGQLATFPTNPDQAAIAYAESYVLVKYLVSVDPSHGLASFVANLKETRDPARAFRRAYGLTEAEVDARLREAISRQSHGVAPAWGMQAALFFAMAILFVFAYLRVRRRSREIRQRMEEEELLERLFEESRRRRHLWGP